MQQITIIGLGLIGGSYALAARRAGFKGRIVGCDRAEFLDQAERMQAIDSGTTEAATAVQGSGLVMLATPVGAIIDLIEKLGPILPPETLLTDVGSTKVEIVRRAEMVFGKDFLARFLPGHPMTGKEQGGIEHADALLFKNRPWLLAVPAEQHKLNERTQTSKALDGAAARWFLASIREVGAQPLPITPERHDELVAWTSHLPQLLATTLAAGIAEEHSPTWVDAAAGPGLRDMTRLAASPYSVWRDILHTNADNIASALLKFEQRLAHLRENLRGPEPREEFERANHFGKPRSTSESE